MCSEPQVVAPGTAANRSLSPACVITGRTECIMAESDILRSRFPETFCRPPSQGSKKKGLWSRPVEKGHESDKASMGRQGWLPTRAPCRGRVLWAVGQKRLRSTARAHDPTGRLNGSINVTS